MTIKEDTLIVQRWEMCITCRMQCEGVFIFEPPYIDRNVNQMWLHAKKEIQSNNNKTEHDR